MALLQTCETDEYWAEYGVLVIRDRGGDADYEGTGLLAEHATESRAGGTIATAGAGWLWARASDLDRDHEVRLEAHDSPPPDDPDALADWDDVAETPYSDTTKNGWEDAGHLLLRRPFARDAAPAARLDVRTGEVERVPFPGAEGNGQAIFVESLADPA